MVTATVSTKDRYDSLIFLLIALATQTVKPQEIIVFDDGKQADLRNDGNYRNVFQMLERKGIDWHVVWGERKGQVKNHIRALEIAKTPWVWRLDDDNVPEPNCLENLLRHTVKPQVGAIASTVLHPDKIFPEGVTSGSMKDVLFKYAAQFASFTGVKEVEHLYSTFLIRREAGLGCYPTDLTPVGHREESTMSYTMFQRGWKLLVDGAAVTWHLRNPKGGIRSFNNAKLWEQDEKRFHERLKEWNVVPQEYFPMVCEGGIGDNFCLRHIFPDIRKKHPNKKIIVATVYPDCYFDEPEVDAIPLDGGHILGFNFEATNPYRFGYYNKYPRRSLLEIYRTIYGV